LAVNALPVFFRYIPKRAFQQAVEKAPVRRGGQPFVAPGSAEVDCIGHRLPRIGGHNSKVIGRHHWLAVGQGFEHSLHLAAKVGTDQLRPKLVTDPEFALDKLKAFKVEIASGQIALVAAFVDDPEGNFADGVVEKHSIQAVD